MCLTPVCEEGSTPPDQGLHPEDMSARQLADALADRYARQPEGVPVCDEEGGVNYIPESNELNPEGMRNMEEPPVDDTMTALVIENILKESEPIHDLYDYLPEPKVTEQEGGCCKTNTQISMENYC